MERKKKEEERKQKEMTEKRKEGEGKVTEKGVSCKE